MHYESYARSMKPENEPWKWLPGASSGHNTTPSSDLPAAHFGNLGH
jgi:hypothetical protein